MPKQAADWWSEFWIFETEESQKKPSGYQPHTWRYRIGRIRGFFLVDQETRIVSMLSVDDRRDAYR